VHFKNKNIVFYFVKNGLTYYNAGAVVVNAEFVGLAPALPLIISEYKHGRDQCDQISL
jgi:hypothetical protein